MSPGLFPIYRFTLLREVHTYLDAETGQQMGGKNPGVALLSCLKQKILMNVFKIKWVYEDDGCYTHELRATLTYVEYLPREPHNQPADLLPKSSQ